MQSEKVDFHSDSLSLSLTHCLCRPVIRGNANAYFDLILLTTLILVLLLPLHYCLHSTAAAAADAAAVKVPAVDGCNSSSRDSTHTSSQADM